jgi:putative mRNA 3-end processing factor
LDEKGEFWGMALVTFTDRGFYCAQADLYIDPLRKVPKALVTHAHSDHARPGMQQYLCHTDSVNVLRLRLGQRISVQAMAYGESIFLNGVEVTLFPAGHVPGSAQVRLSYRGEVWVISGDYKTVGDGVTPAWEPVRCHHFVTESTFALPIFQWRTQQLVFDDINAWWRENSALGQPSILLGYSLGKAQRILRHLDRSVGPVVCHGAIASSNLSLEASGFDFGTWEDGTSGLLALQDAGVKLSESLVICPPNALRSAWVSPLGNHYVLANCSGWMAVSKSGDWGGLDKGFVLSDHADWPQLLEAVEATGAEHVHVTHGFSDVLARYLRESMGVDADVVEQALFEREDT